MKKISLVLLLCCFIYSSIAQLQEMETTGWSLVGQVKRVGTTIAKMEYKVFASDTAYHLLMKDFKQQPEINYFSLSFRSTDQAFGRFYNLLKSFFLPENKKKDYMKTFRLGTEGVNLQHTTVIGSKAVRLTTTEGYINLSEKDIDKIFGMR
ncbi:MAG: hypothetical protein EOO13_05350 [Chitinophagaceae bacterium]|nr:MAG: hypothetical protein EOO13_05350 [Chitinophagaceae bacterium]